MAAHLRKVAHRTAFAPLTNISIPAPNECNIAHDFNTARLDWRSLGCSAHNRSSRVVVSSPSIPGRFEPERVAFSQCRVIGGSYVSYSEVL